MSESDQASAALRRPPIRWEKRVYTWNPDRKSYIHKDRKGIEHVLDAYLVDDARPGHISKYGCVVLNES